MFRCERRRRARKHRCLPVESSDFQWVHRIGEEAPDSPTAEPSRVAVDETAIKIGREQCWLYATIDVDSKLLLGVRVSRWRAACPASAFLSELMAARETVSAEDFRQVLAEADDADAVQRLMAAITYKEIDHLTQGEAAELYGFSSTWASKWFNRLEQLTDEPFEDVVYDDPRSGRPSKLSESEHQRFVDDNDPGNF